MNETLSSSTSSISDTDLESQCNLNLASNSKTSKSKIHKYQTARGNFYLNSFYFCNCVNN